MVDFELFHFLRPQWFVALLPLALLTWFMFFRKGAQSNWEALIDERLLPYLLVRGAGSTRRMALILTVTGGLLGIVSLAGPAWSRLPQPVFTSQDALVIALDLTRSMDASDVSPSRLERARYKISDILAQRQGEQTALLVYAGEAFTVTPLTDDGATIRSQLQALDTAIMPVTGNRTDKAVTLALALLKQGGMRRGHVLLITDEATPDSAGDSVALLRNGNYRLSVLGVGTRHGAPVLRPDGGFLQDRDGEIVIPILDEDALRGLAGAGGGLYVRLTRDDQDTRQLTGFFSEAPAAGVQAGAGVTADVWREQGPWLVLCLLPMVALLFRRGYVLVLALFLLPLPGPVSALDWGDLWLRRDQQGQRAMDAGDYAAAAELFDDSAWKAAAQHRVGDYQGAVDSLEARADAQSNYNRGNALARLGRYHEAIAAYDQALAQQPDHADAQYNKALLENELERQRQQSESQRHQEGEQQQGQDQQDPAPQQGAQAPQQAGPEDPARSSQHGERQQQAETSETLQPEPRQQAQDRDVRQQPAHTDDTKSVEEQQATEQWLRRIPDDPSGLLRRKFSHQYQQRRHERSRDDKTW